ncbi:MAG: V-type ATP synthase subunit E [Treponema sp. GWB1_62_6]|nr:MAG: V-type ATP synthase subunit E [Treponema sp. GWA1_62_8]OHE62605.1 MAG: V-type ATP synthase subunit E [Treponema sp. GWB1_62_6]OHE63974.1 MAG: V-type ATP synthase subunit E [Treponema sp. GWC1_61_84]OHE68707.1 MAG: V-type ATP synthase subunit E [Treponema sp. RIFOXYC1_FULL_61_9]HCM27983.1 V-type ATP synthase subunit E [Treponema sp.]
MDVQLQELIDKIKKDGIESASAEAARVRAEAEAEAKRIVEAGRREAADLVSKGKADAERSEKAGIAAVQQASRNLVLSFKAEMERLLEALVVRETAAAYSDDTLKAVIPELVKSWAARGQDSLDLLLPADSVARLDGFFKSALAAELKKGMEIKGERTLGAGFRIAARDGSAYYDFSADAVAELLSAYLNPRLAEILKAAVKGM